MSDTEIDKLVASLTVLGPTDKIVRPSGYPNSLAMCVMDSIWSLSANYKRHVMPVLHRYASEKGVKNLQDVHDSPAELVTFIESRPGGPSAFADLVRNHQRTSTRNGVLKAEAVYEAAKLFQQSETSTPTQLLKNAETVEAAWRRLPGQCSSATGWRYLLLLAGAAEVKPDRMIIRFVERAVGRTPTPDQARDLVLAASERLAVDPAALDHAIWIHQRNERKTR